LKQWGKFAKGSTTEVGWQIGQQLIHDNYAVEVTEPERSDRPKAHKVKTPDRAKA
jgi:hypothetical protein